MAKSTAPHDLSVTAWNLRTRITGKYQLHAGELRVLDGACRESDLIDTLQAGTAGIRRWNSRGQARLPPFPLTHWSATPPCSSSSATRMAFPQDSPILAALNDPQRRAATAGWVGQFGWVTRNPRPIHVLRPERSGNGRPAADECADRDSRTRQCAHAWCDYHAKTRAAVSGGAAIRSRPVGLGERRTLPRLCHAAQRWVGLMPLARPVPYQPEPRTAETTPMTTPVPAEGASVSVNSGGFCQRQRNPGSGTDLVIDRFGMRRGG